MRMRMHVHMHRAHVQCTSAMRMHILMHIHMHMLDARASQCAEGPTALPLPEGGWIILYDGYRTDCRLWLQGEEGACPALSGLELQIAQGAGSSTSRCEYYGAGGFGALYSPDLKVWTDVSDGVRIPSTHKHGTALQLEPAALCAICADVRGGPLEPAALLGVWASLGVLEWCSQAGC